MTYRINTYIPGWPKSNKIVEYRGSLLGVKRRATGTLFWGAHTFISNESGVIARRSCDAHGNLSKWN